MDIKEMITVMQAHADGKKIEWRTRSEPDLWDITTDPDWNLDTYEYRITPEPKKEGRWERVDVILSVHKIYEINDHIYGSQPIDALLRIPGFGGIDYRSPFDEKRIVQSMVPVMFDPFGGAMTAGFSGINTSCRPGIPVAAWFWREGEK